MRLGLTAQILIGGVIVAVIFLIQFALTTNSFRSIRHDTRQEQRADASVVAALDIKNSILGLQTGLRGYVLTSDQRLLQPYVQARRDLPAQSRLLMTLAPGAVSTELDREWRAYVRDWAAPLIALTARSPARARSKIQSGQGVRRVNRMQALIDPFDARMDAIAERDRARVAHAVDSGLSIGILGAAIRALVFGAIIAYLLRFAVAPIRRIAAATQRVAGGDLDVTVPEQGPGEIGQLARSFNEMAESLVRQRRDLATQNLDLERLANVLRAVLDSTVDGILLSDADGNVQLANRRLLTLTGELGMSYEGPVVDRLLSVEHRIKDRDQYRAAMERLRTNPDDETFDEFEDSVSGRVFQGFTAPVRDDRGGSLGRVWTLRDVTQQRELDRLKDDFVATVSHELRTPLTSMMGFLEMLREGEAGQLTDEQKGFLAIVYRSSERLQRLVGDLLFVARLDASGLQLHFAPVRLDEIGRELVESSAALARARELALESDLAEVAPVRGDHERLVQLAGNLLSNAIKFTPAGGTVTVRTFVDGGKVVLEVADTGIGIPEGEQDRLFQRFFRSSTATEQAIPGTGLGLVISRAIVEAHGGTIGVTSQAGAGTCFRVELPIASPEAVT